MRRFVEACRYTRTILPATTTIERICADALVDAERRIEARIAERVPPGLRRDLEYLLEETVDAGVTRFVWLRQFEPGNNSADANRLLDRLEHLRRLAIPEGLFHDVPAHRITRLRRQGERYFADGLRELPDSRRLAILAVCAVEWELFLADAVVETHDRIPAMNSSPDHRINPPPLEGDFLGFDAAPAPRRPVAGGGPPVPGQHPGRPLADGSGLPGELRAEARRGDRHRGARGSAAGVVQLGEVGGQGHVVELAAVEPGVQASQRPGVGAAVFSLTEASTSRRAVCVGRPIAASSGSILAGESFMFTVTCETLFPSALRRGSAPSVAVNIGGTQRKPEDRINERLPSTHFLIGDTHLRRGPRLR